MNDSDSISLAAPRAAAFLEAPLRTLEGWRRQGIGPAFIRFNHSSVRYRRSDLIKFLEQNTVVAAGCPDRNFD